MRKVAFTLALTAALTSVAHADVLTLGENSSNQASSLPGPMTGLKGRTMDQILNQFGEPAKRYDPISVNRGEFQPPITRWDYDKMTFIFEYDHVVHAVAPKRPPKLVRSE
jgi:hypothetical protein